MLRNCLPKHVDVNSSFTAFFVVVFFAGNSEGGVVAADGKRHLDAQLGLGLEGFGLLKWPRVEVKTARGRF